MNKIPLLLAAVDAEDFTGAWHSPSGATKQYLVMLGAMTLVAAAVLIWAAYFRKHRRHSHHHHHHHSSRSTPSPSPNATESVSKHHKRRRRRRREHRPRNPTLAETGGLPPIRVDKPSGPVP